MTGIACCACAASGRTTVAAPTRLINSRRLMSTPGSGQGMAPTQLSHRKGVGDSFSPSSARGRPMSVVGQTATWRKDRVMSVLAPITDSVSTMRGWPYLPALRSNSLPRPTDQGLQKINDLPQHYGVSADAVMTLLQALLNSKGTMAQFDHRELGGAGQWMAGGMTMVGDMFNHRLKAKVDGLCSELSQIL